MTKDQVYTIIGAISSILIATKTYAESVTLNEWSFYFGIVNAGLVAILGYWAKKGE